MRETIENKYVKRTQRDYSHAFKLSVVAEVERGELGIKAAARKYGIQSHSTVTNWLRKYGNFDWVKKSTAKMPKSKDQRLESNATLITEGSGRRPSGNGSHQTGTRPASRIVVSI